MNDMEVLRKAYEHENDPRLTKTTIFSQSWTHFGIGASRDDVNRLVNEGMVIVTMKSTGLTKYRLSDKGREFVWASTMEREMTKIPATSVLGAMELVVGFDDIKETIASAIERQRKVNFLLEGPPACAKSLILEGVRAAIPGAYITFGSKTSAAGLSDVLFERQPSHLLMDELDKMHNDAYSVLLGLMEGGEVLDTKSQKTRGIKLETMVLGACNSSAKMPPEFLSRFFHFVFPKYTRQEFIDVCIGFLTRVESCSPEMAEYIGSIIFDNELGDVRRVRSVWALMNEPTHEEAQRIIQMMVKYSPNGHSRKKATLKEQTTFLEK